MILPQLFSLAAKFSHRFSSGRFCVEQSPLWLHANSMQFSLEQFSLKNSPLFENSPFDSPSNDSPFEILQENTILPGFKGEFKSKPL